MFREISMSELSVSVEHVMVTYLTMRVWRYELIV